MNPVMALIFAIGAFLMWRRDTSRRYLFGMIAAPLALGTSFAINHYLTDLGVLPVRLLTSVFAFTAVISIVWATCRRLDKRPPLMIWIISALMCLILMAFSDPESDITVWVFLINGFSGIVFATGAQTLEQAKSPDPIDRATIWVFTIIAIQFFARPVIIYLIGGPMGSEAYRESVGHAAYLVVGALSMVMLAGVLMGSAVVDLMKALKASAQTDSLSGLAMRDAFVEQASGLFANAHSKGVPVSIIVADIDHFKKVNDLWGHPAGDKAIATFGQVFLRTIRPSDLAGRIGGEEFCIIAWDCGEEAAAGLAERLRVQFAREEHVGIGSDIRLTASFGVAAWKTGEGYLSAYERADAALYRAKRAGRDRVVSNALGQMSSGQEPADEAQKRSAQQTVDTIETRPEADIVELAPHSRDRREQA